MGHIPHGFYEHQMKGFFEQFGDVKRWRLSRNKKTGKSKHYAYLEFADSDVAAIAAETMNNYMMMDQLLQCRVVEDDKLHPDTFAGANRAFKRIPWKKLDNEQHNKKRTEAETVKRTNNLKSKEAKQRAKVGA